MKRLLLFIMILASITSFAQKTSKVKELERQRKATLLEINNTSKLLNDMGKSTANLLTRIKLIASQISSRQKVVELLSGEIEGLSAEQKRVESEIVILESELKEKQKSYAKAVDGMLRNRQNDNKLLFVLSGKSLTESYRRLRYLREYSEWRSTQASEIKEKNNTLKTKREELIKMKAGKQALLSQRTSEQSNLKQEETSYQQEVGEAQAKQKDLQKILSQKRTQAAALDKQIEKLIAEEIARQEREAARKARERAAAAAANSGTPKGTSKAPVVVPKASPEDVKLSSNFALNKGKLPSPITGNYVISSRYGIHRHSKYVETSNDGIDIQSQSGADARAVFEGDVVTVMAFPGYNYGVIIRHGNYFTFYANIQSVYVKQGDKVKTGQTIGKVYTDPDTNTSELHFQVRNGNAKMNPESWIR